MRSTPPAGRQVHIFGIKKSAETRRALRFFPERRVKTHFVDLAERAAALGLRTALYGEEKWLSILAEEPFLLKQPLVRMQQKLCVGVDEKLFKEWVA